MPVKNREKRWLSFWSATTFAVRGDNVICDFPKDIFDDMERVNAVKKIRAFFKKELLGNLSEVKKNPHRKIHMTVYHDELIAIFPNLGRLYPDVVQLQTEILALVQAFVDMPGNEIAWQAIIPHILLLPDEQTKQFQLAIPVPNATQAMLVQHYLNSLKRKDNKFAGLATQRLVEPSVVTQFITDVAQRYDYHVPSNSSQIVKLIHFPADQIAAIAMCDDLLLPVQDHNDNKPIAYSVFPARQVALQEQTANTNTAEINRFTTIEFYGAGSVSGRITIPTPLGKSQEVLGQLITMLGELIKASPFKEISFQLEDDSLILSNIASAYIVDLWITMMMQSRDYAQHPHMWRLVDLSLPITHPHRLENVAISFLNYQTAQVTLFAHDTEYFTFYKIGKQYFMPTVRALQRQIDQASLQQDNATTLASATAPRGSSTLFGTTPAPAAPSSDAATPPNPTHKRKR